MNDFPSEPHDDMADAADLLRSLEPRKPQLNWQAIVAELPSESQSIATPALPSTVRKLATSWWSGALAGSLITFALFSSMGSPQQSDRSNTVDAVAKVEDGSTITNSQINSTPGKSQLADAPLLGSPSELIADDMTEALMNRHGLSTRMVSSSAISTTWRASPFDSSEDNSQPLRQSTLRKMLLDVN